jgi:hypothetical protein
MNANGPRLSIALSFHIRWESLCLSRMTIITQGTKVDAHTALFRCNTNTRKLLAFLNSMRASLKFLSACRLVQKQ